MNILQLAKVAKPLYLPRVQIRCLIAQDLGRRPNSVGLGRIMLILESQTGQQCLALDLEIYPEETVYPVEVLIPKITTVKKWYVRRGELLCFLI
jgi:hypothetical protein